MKYNIDIYTLCWNEMKIAPFVLKYWQQFARHVYIYDNGSDDRCLQFFEHFSWITVIPFNTPEGFNDLKHQAIKNNCWKNSDADWVVVCDFDECLYDDNLELKLDWLEANNYTITHTWFKETISENFPKLELGKLLHQYDDVKLIPMNKKDKSILFKPNKIKEINYVPGAHECKPTGLVKHYTNNKEVKLSTIHIKNLSLQYIFDRNEMYRNRMSKTNKEHHFAVHYYFDKQKIADEFNKKLNS